MRRWPRQLMVKVKETVVRRRPLRASWPVLAIGVLLLAFALAGVVIWWLLSQTTGLTGQDAARLRVESIRTGLTVGASAGGALALVLAVRRQWHTETDAAERRLTELFTKAVEQLGSDQPAVRIGALYSLERVGQGNPGYQQKVVDVLCGYLRMPFTPPREPRAHTARGLGLRPRDPIWMRPNTTVSGAAQQDAKQEKQVRLTTERILTRHLRGARFGQPTGPDFWPNLDVDLTDATLCEPHFEQCRFGLAHFGGAQFGDHVNFTDAQFGNDAKFNSARFGNDAKFAGARFGHRVSFTEARFGFRAEFKDARFGSGAEFDGARFDDCVNFAEAQFGDDAGFAEAQFGDDAGFAEARFGRSARFTDTVFGKRAYFRDARFKMNASFHGAQFGNDASFDDARFSAHAEFTDAWFGACADFDRAQFGQDPDFDGMEFGERTSFNKVWVSGGVEVVDPPHGWFVDTDGYEDGGYLRPIEEKPAWDEESDEDEAG